MIPAQARTDHPDRWQTELAEAFTEPAQLFFALDLPLPEPAVLERMREAAARFRLRVPRSYVALMERGNPDDPLLRQVLPVGDELLDVPGFVADPVGDLQVMAGDGLLHKYDGRRLLRTTGACAVHCRYCFRREYPYADDNASARGWQPVVERLRRDHGATEIILSGGEDRKSTRLNSSHITNSYAVFCLKKKKNTQKQ